MRRTLLTSLLLATALSTAVLSTAAGAQSGPDRNPATVQAGAYTLEPSHTRILFGVSHFGFSTYYGFFNDASGTLQFDPAMPAKSVLNVSIRTDSVETGNSKLDGELKSADWFDADANPALTFQSTAIVPTGADAGDVTGNLTMHGVTRPVTLHVTFNGGGINPISKKYTVGFEASGTVKRAEFGITKYEGGIGDDVKLIISGAFEHS